MAEEARREVISRTPSGTERGVERLYREPSGEVDVDDVETMWLDPFDTRRAAIVKVVQAIYLVFGVIIWLIGIRFVFMLLGANPAAPFAAFIYRLTAPFVGPFSGLFASQALGCGMALEIHDVVAMIVYGLIAWLLARIIWLIFETRTGLATGARNVRTRVR